MLEVKTENGVPVIVSEVKEDHELAADLLLKTGEQPWEAGAELLATKDDEPVCVAWAVVAVPNDGSYRLPFGEKDSFVPTHMPGEKRSGIFLYKDGAWQKAEPSGEVTCAEGG